MCQSCWGGYGFADEDTEPVREAAVRIKRLRNEFSEVGGDLHIVVDDWNLEDSHIDFCADAIRENAHGLSDIGLAVERDLIAALSALTVRERASALALADGFWMCIN